MKTRGWLVLAIVLLVVAVMADAGLARHAENELRQRMSAGLSPVQAYADRVSVGMPRAAVEVLLKGYRQYSIFEAGGEETVTYRYWWGFIPPLRGFRYKTVGSVEVRYSSEGRAMSAKYWLN